jgi:hypothetical protein
LHAASRSSTDTPVHVLVVTLIVLGELADVSEALRLVIAIVILEVWILLSAIIPSQFQETFAISCGIDAVGRWSGNGLVTRVAKKVEVEICILILAGSQQGHAENVLVKLE